MPSWGFWWHLNPAELCSFGLWMSTEPPWCHWGSQLPLIDSVLLQQQKNNTFIFTAKVSHTGIEMYMGLLNIISVHFYLTPLLSLWIRKISVLLWLSCERLFVKYTIVQGFIRLRDINYSVQLSSTVYYFKLTLSLQILPQTSLLLILLKCCVCFSHILQTE